MQHQSSGAGEGLRRLLELVRRVNSSTDTEQVLEEIVSGVVEGLGFGLAAISRLERETFAVKAYAGPDSMRDQLMGRRTPVQAILDQFRLADSWGILRYVPHFRADDDFLENAWIPDYEPDDAPDAWHPHSALYAPLYSATGELIGNMAVDFPPNNRIPNQELRDLLELFVVQAGLALSNAQQRERLAETARFSDVVKTVALTSSSDCLDSKLLRSAKELNGGFQAIQTYVTCLPHAASLRVQQGVGFPHDSIPTVLTVDREFERIGDYLYLDRDAKTPVHPAFSAKLFSALTQLIDEHSASSLASAPIGVGTEVLGYLTIIRASEAPLSDAERGAFLEAASELGRAFLNTRIYERESLLVAEFQELDRYKDELIATISHELKTPLSAIVGYSEMLEDEVGGSDFVQAITRNAARLDSLISDLLDYSRVQSKREQVRIPVDLVETCAESMDSLKIHADRSEISLAFLRPDSQATVAADPGEMSRILDNLVGNAIKYTARGGSVSISIEYVGDDVEIRVTDDGMGISKADQSRLFSPFARSSNPEALSIPGTGLGLAISRRIAQAHRGDITVDSKLGVGSVFSLRLPVEPP